MSVYLDTSALAKLYLNEPGSGEFASFLAQCDRPTISTLVMTELDSLLHRHRRAGHIDADYARTARRLLIDDLTQERLSRVLLTDEHVSAAGTLIRRLETCVRTLDALHLAVCQSAGLGALATADLRMADAAAEMSLEIVRF